jgi:hypothetical protein
VPKKKEAMDLSPTNLFASMFIGAVGFVLYRYGRKQERVPQVVAGIALMVYPYFVVSIGWMLVVGAAIVVALVGAIRAGL